MATPIPLNDIAEAIKAQIRTVLDGFAEVYDPDDVPGIRLGADEAEPYPQAHVEVSFYRVDEFVARRSSGEVSAPTFELHTLCHADSITTVRKLRRLVQTALEDIAVDLPDGSHVGPFVFDVGEREDDDDRGQRGVDHWTFA